MQRLAPIVHGAKGRHTATLIFLHGLGDTGHGWGMALQMFAPPYLKVVCPNAPLAKVTLNMGMEMPSWYDIYHLDDNPDRPRENLEDVQQSVQYLQSIIQNETGPDIPKSRILIGGFSQGGAVALSTLFSEKNRASSSEGSVAGCVALSTYMPGNKVPELKEKISTPIFQCHGEMDEVISIERGRLTNQILNKLASNVEFETFPYMGHENTQEEMISLTKFIQKTLG